MGQALQARVACKVLKIAYTGPDMTSAIWHVRGKQFKNDVARRLRSGGYQAILVALTLGSYLPVSWSDSPAGWCSTHISQVQYVDDSAVSSHTLRSPSSLLTVLQ